MDGIDPALAEIAITTALGSGAISSSLFALDLAKTKISMQTMIWNEYGITYGKTVMQTKNERLNVGGRIKLLQGLYSMYAFLDDMKYKLNEKDTLLVLSSHVGYGHSSNLEFNPNALKFGFGGKPSIGLDLGATYEFYPLTDVRSRTSSEPKTTPLQHEYKYKIGFSLQDLGWITYLKPAHARDFTMEVDQKLDFSSVRGSGTTPLANMDDSLNKKYKMNGGDDKFRMNLPTLASLQGDYYAGKNIYINSTLNYAFQFSNNAHKIHEITTFSITPRWDWKWLGFYLPLSYNKYSHFRLGVSTRIGPLIVGMADILPIISKRDVYGVDLHVMLKVPHIQLKKKKTKTKPRIISKFDVKSEPDKKNNDKGDMPKKDSSPEEYKQPKPENKNIRIHVAPGASREKKVRKHIFPRIHLFKKKNRHSSGKGKEHTIYFTL